MEPDAFEFDNANDNRTQHLGHSCRIHRVTPRKVAALRDKSGWIGRTFNFETCCYNFLMGDMSYSSITSTDLLPGKLQRESVRTTTTFLKYNFKSRQCHVVT
jgi:hypothetical protein